MEGYVLYTIFLTAQSKAAVGHHIIISTQFIYAECATKQESCEADVKHYVIDIVQKRHRR
jgi:hypothetical protein